MEGNSIPNSTPLKVDDRGCNGVLLNGDDEEVESPKSGMEFASEDEVHGYYNKYAQRKGFGIMRRSSRCDDGGRLVYFILACSQSGKERSISKGRFQWRQTAKTNCGAKINVVLDSQGRFHLCNVVLDHNHELTPGKLHRTICKKSRLKKRRSRKEQAGIAPCCPDLHSMFGEPQGCENLSPDSSLGGASVSNQLVNGDKPFPCSYNGHSAGGTVFNCLDRRSSMLEGSQNSQDSLRRALAKRAVELVKSGMVIGLGTGSTLSPFIEELGKLIREGKLKNVVAVGANYQSRIVARQFGMATVDLNDVNDIDIAFDCVDEVDFNKNLLKCRGAGHTVQKVIDSMAKVCIILAEHTKVVHRLGSNIPVAVEVLPVAVSPVLRRLIALGGVPEVRSALRKDGSVITDLGNMVIDVSFPSAIQNPAELEKNINMVPGVVDNGIISGVATFVLVALKDGGNVKVMNLEEFVEVVLRWRHPNSTL